MHIFQLGKWKVDTSEGRIWQPGKKKEKYIRSKLMHVLSLLVQAEGRVVTRKELLIRGWPETVASDESLTRCIADLRRLLEDNDENSKLIETVPKRGYRLRQLKNGTGEENSEGNRTNHPSKDISIVVIPFSGSKNNPHIDFLADGITEEVIEALTRTPTIRVISRPSSFRLKGDTDFEQVAHLLDVRFVLRGSLSDQAGHLQLKLELIEAETQVLRWAETFGCNVSEITELNAKIVMSLAKNLGIPTQHNSPSKRKTNPQAYVLMIQGRHLGNLLTAEGWKQSNDHFKRALSIDPEYAVVWASLAKNYAWEACYGVGGSFEEGFTLARAAINRALEIEPDNPFSLAMAGWLHLYDRFDLQASAQSFQAALKYEPENTETLLEATYLARALGKLDLATEISRFVISRDPVNPGAYRNLGICLRLQGQLDDSILAFEKALSLSPELTSGNTLLGFVLIESKRLNQALEEIRQESSEAWRLVGLAMVFHALGMPPESSHALDELINKYERRAAINVAYIEAFRGNIDRSFWWLEKAREFHDPGLAHLANEKLFIPLHGDDRWPELLRHTGQVPQQLKEIEFMVNLPELSVGPR